MSSSKASEHIVSADDKGAREVQVTPVHVLKKDARDVVLIPQPSDDPADPLNWPIRKKLIIFACICLAGFAGQMSPNSNQLTFMLQVPAYRKTPIDMLNSVAASLAGWMAGPFIITPLAAAVGRSSVILWSLVGTAICQIWAANMTGLDQFIPFVISRLICGLFGVIPAIMGTGYIIDMFFLHQRGKAFAIFEVLIIFAVVGGGTIGGFIAENDPWQYVFWWTLGPIGGAMVGVFVFVEDTTFDRRGGVLGRESLPASFIGNRIATFLPGSRTQPVGKGKELKRRYLAPLKITFAPITILVGTFVFVALGLPIMQASTLAVYVMPPTIAGGYGFSSLQVALFSMTAWVGILSAQLYGYLFNDRIPLWVARRRGGTWHPEYRLANAILPGILIPAGLAIYGVCLHFHFHIMVLALGSFIIWLGALLVLPICYNYIIECFVQTPVEASVALNSYRIAFGVMSVFIITPWEKSVGVGWMWGMGSLFVLFVDMIMLAVIFKGHLIRKLTVHVSKTIAATEDGEKIIDESSEIRSA